MKWTEALICTFILVLLGYTIMEYGTDKTVLLPIVTGLLGFAGGFLTKR